MPAQSKETRIITRCSAYFTLILLAFGLASACEAGSYDFCVIRLSKGDDSRGTEDRMHARFKHGEIDPGREAARVIVSQRFKKANTTSLQVVDYRESDCPGSDVSEFTVEASAEQLQQFFSQITSADPGALVTGAAIVVGASVDVVKGTGEVVQGVGDAAKLKLPGEFRG